MTRTRFALALAVALLLPSCTPDTKPQWDNNDHTVVRWVPDPAADLMAPEGTFIRAATESMNAARIAEGHGVEAIKNGGYPGFEHAFNNVSKLDEFDGDKNRYGNLVVGALYHSVIGLTRNGDRYTAEVCIDGRQTAQKRDDGTYIINNLDNWVVEVSMTFGPDPKLPADQQHSPPVRQKGPAQRPADDVFGSWVLFDYTAINQINPKCKSFAPPIPDEWTKPTLFRDPPPTLPPDPGWPEGSSA
ncbi:hypothetical protein [Mycobacteroides abscessus]|uniref:hypothetical protein n=1 Tax=Mycobacteroides abscessus TaxID=36809 RepID=UPI0005DEC79E|nr:hypothetical protein [Mycobacteroides abscessus]CPR78990.1 Hypothetical protein ERS075493_02968 [Mycobacteroides abscessus]CPR88157.1 Hypothetical protein ERS075492_03783 [Mycobacteroides abscessus]CPS43142.1 Hypothetical protein ERS075511_02430 [Mycobacteroides abscessus]CPV02915.1 Hypothetical protein ERS075568_03563 [Mycobacteroides abscessus]